MAEILIIQADRQIGQQMASVLSREGHTCKVTRNAEAAEEYLRLRSYALVVIDAELPWAESFVLMDYIAQRSWPIIFTTYDAASQDRLQVLYDGPSRVLLCPYARSDLLQNVQMVMKDCEKRLSIGDLELKIADKTAVFHGEPLDLTAQEFALLQALVQNPNMILTRDHLLKIAWGYQLAGESRTVDVHVQRLRKKLGHKQYIETVYKSGYRLHIQ